MSEDSKLPSPAARPDEVCLGPALELAPGTGWAYEVAGSAVAVFRTRDGALYATQNKCPHAGAALADGSLGATNIICPLHGWKFSLKNGACLNDPNYRLRVYPIREEGGEVFITVGY